MCRYSDERYAQNTKEVIGQVIDWALVILGRPAWSKQHLFTREQVKEAKYLRTYGLNSFLVRWGKIIAGGNAATTWISGSFLQKLNTVIELRRQETLLHQRQADRTLEEIAKDEDHEYFVSTLAQLHWILEDAQKCTKRRHNNRNQSRDSEESTSLVSSNPYASLIELSSPSTISFKLVLDLCVALDGQSIPRSPELSLDETDILKVHITVEEERSQRPMADLQHPKADMSTLSMIEDRVKALEQLEDPLSTTLRSQRILRQKKGKLPDLMALPADLHLIGSFGHNEGPSLPSPHIQLYQSSQIRILFLHRWVFSEARSKTKTILGAINIINLICQRGRLKTPWPDGEFVIEHHGLIKIFGQDSRPNFWPDINRALCYIWTDNAVNFLKPSHLMWHLAAINAENQLDGPPPLHAVIASYFTSNKKPSSQAMTPEQRRTAVADMAAKEVRKWYFDYHMFSEEVCCETTEIFLSVAGTHYDKWTFDENSKQAKMWQLSKLLTKRNDLSDNAFGVLPSKMSKLFDQKGRICVSKIQKEIELD